MEDQWNEDLLKLEKTYGQALANHISNLVDEGQVPLANFLIYVLTKE